MSSLFDPTTISSVGALSGSNSTLTVAASNLGLGSIAASGSKVLSQYKEYFYVEHLISAATDTIASKQTFGFCTQAYRDANSGNNSPDPLGTGENGDMIAVRFVKSGSNFTSRLVIKRSGFAPVELTGAVITYNANDVWGLTLDRRGANLAVVLWRNGNSYLTWTDTAGDFANTDLYYAVCVLQESSQNLLAAVREGRVVNVEYPPTLPSDLVMAWPPFNTTGGRFVEVKPHGGGDYTSLNAALTDMYDKYPDIAALEGDLIFGCTYDGVDADPSAPTITIPGFTDGTTSYRVRLLGSGSNWYRVNSASAITATFQNKALVNVSQFHFKDSMGSWLTRIEESCENVEFDRCVFDGFSRTSTYGIYADAANTFAKRVKATNCVFYKCSRGVSLHWTAGATVQEAYWTNNTYIDCNEGHYSYMGSTQLSSIERMNNNIFDPTCTICVATLGPVPLTGDSNITSDATSPNGVSWQNLDIPYPSASTTSLDVVQRFAPDAASLVSPERERFEEGVDPTALGEALIQWDFILQNRPAGQPTDCGHLLQASTSIVDITLTASTDTTATLALDTIAEPEVVDISIVAGTDTASTIVGVLGEDILAKDVPQLDVTVGDLAGTGRAYQGNDYIFRAKFEKDLASVDTWTLDIFNLRNFYSDPIFSTSAADPNIEWELEGTKDVLIIIPASYLSLVAGLHRITATVLDRDGRILTVVDTTLTVIHNKQNYTFGG